MTHPYDSPPADAGALALVSGVLKRGTKGTYVLGRAAVGLAKMPAERRRRKAQERARFEALALERKKLEASVAGELRAKNAPSLEKSLEKLQKVKAVKKARQCQSALQAAAKAKADRVAREKQKEMERQKSERIRVVQKSRARQRVRGS